MLSCSSPLSKLSPHCSQTAFHHMVCAAVQDAPSQPTHGQHHPHPMLSSPPSLQLAPTISHPRYVRLYKTPPPKLRMDNTTEEQARILLLVLVQRHWKHHGPFITPFFEQLGALQHKVLAQVWGKHSVCGNGRLGRVGRRGRGARLRRDGS